MTQNFMDIEFWKKSGLLAQCLAALDLEVPRQSEINLLNSFGKKIDLQCQIHPFSLRGERHLLVQLVDLTTRKQMEDQLRHIAFHDSLTRLPNRRLLIDRLHRAIQNSKRQNSHVAVLFLDLNKFKLLNDTHGHDVGDLLLVEVARRLQQVVRDIDTVARLGGDEFVVLLEGLGTELHRASEAVAVVAEKLNSSLSEEYVLGPVRHVSSASIGVKLFIGDQVDPDQILKDADAAMYEAKKSMARVMR